mmetsp:Transcript_30129/g.48172  ORF Transcript_30129/g.48172 Transcript_30129/m.48172 type:complete len:91 (-) Transcript_30129:470-742(-)
MENTNKRETKQKQTKRHTAHHHNYMNRKKKVVENKREHMKIGQNQKQEKQNKNAINQNIDKHINKRTVNWSQIISYSVIQKKRITSYVEK